MQPELNRSTSPDHALLKDLRYRSTFALLLLSIFSLSIYTAHYMMRQAHAINRHIAPEYKMSIGYTRAVLVLMYVSALATIPYFFVEDVQMLDNMNDVLNIISATAIAGWCLLFRSRMNFLLNVRRKDKKFFNLIWSIIFSAFYINFKISRVHRLLSRELPEGG